MSPPPIRLHDKFFKVYLRERTILHNIEIMAARISHDYKGKQPLFVSVLNGSFMFSADLLKEVSIPCEISFVKLASYQAMASTGQVREVLGLNESLENRHVIILEDIVDTGHTVVALRQTLERQKPASIDVATLLLKPDSLEHPFDPRYTGISISNEFVVGYGLDYNGLGRNLRDIYKVF
ncbi:hypoxanthine phosphoribosyltransferase [soil metagenome]